MTKKARSFNQVLRVCASKLCLFALVPFLCSFWPFEGEQGSTLIHVSTTESTNEGRPFCLYIKEVEKGEFIRHEYQEIVQEVNPFAEEAPAIQPYFLHPGKNYDIRIPRKHMDKPLGIYVLYTNPGDDWKLLATGSNKVTVSLGDSEILNAYIK